MKHEVQYSPVAEEHLYRLPARQRRIVLDGVDEQLAFEPTVETRRRKRMRPNPLAPWELRLGDLRVFYDVVEDALPVVVILAIGRKKGNQLTIGDEVIEL